MSGGAAIIAASALATAAWLAGRLCSATSWPQPVDVPNERSLHVRPTPRTGGLAIWGGLIVGLGGGILMERAGMRGWPADWPMQTDVIAWIAGMVAVVGLVSFLDDCTGVSGGVRLIVHALAASGVVAGAGLVMSSVTIPAVGTLAFDWLAVPVTVLVIVWMANLYNFMDGMDGFAGGMTWIGFGFLSLVAWMGGHVIIFLVALLVSMAAAGFLFYNHPPARIFMGDVGSVPIGFLAGTLAVVGVRDGVFDLWVPLLIFSPFIVDATVTVLRRMLLGRQFWRAHREHYYQRLVLAGWGHRKTVLVEYVLMLASGTMAMLYVHGSEPVRAIILAGGLVVYVALACLVRAVEINAGKQSAEA